MSDYRELERRAQAAIGFDDVSVAPDVLLELIADLKRNQRMLLAACMDMGAIGNALGADMNSDGEELLSMVVELKAENEALRKDAVRYRWLRHQPNDCSAPRIDICHWVRNGDDSVNEGEGLRESEADDAIDAAMGKGYQP